MSILQNTVSRRGFCLCCIAATYLAASRFSFGPRSAYAAARNIPDKIREAAAETPITVHKLRRNVSILEGSGGNIAVLTGQDGKVFIDAGITASRPRILGAVNSLSNDPIRHLINTHWHFDHADGNQWLTSEGAAILAHENTGARQRWLQFSVATPGLAFFEGCPLRVILRDPWTKGGL